MAPGRRPVDLLVSDDVRRQRNEPAQQAPEEGRQARFGSEGQADLGDDAGRRLGRPRGGRRDAEAGGGAAGSGVHGLLDGW